MWTLSLTVLIVSSRQQFQHTESILRSLAARRLVDNVNGYPCQHFQGIGMSQGQSTLLDSQGRPWWACQLTMGALTSAGHICGALGNRLFINNLSCHIFEDSCLALDSHTFAKVCKLSRHRSR